MPEKSSLVYSQQRREAHIAALPATYNIHRQNIHANTYVDVHRHRSSFDSLNLRFEPRNAAIVISTSSISR